MRLDLPAQSTMIDRRKPYDLPYLILGTAEDGTIVETLPQGGFGTDPNDPAAILSLDPRGWYCPSAFPCTWLGLL